MHKKEVSYIMILQLYNECTSIMHHLRLTSYTALSGAQFVELWRALGPVATSVARAYPGHGGSWRIMAGWQNDGRSPALQVLVSPELASAGLAKAQNLARRGPRCACPWLCEFWWVLPNLDCFGFSSFFLPPVLEIKLILCVRWAQIDSGDTPSTRLVIRFR